MTKPRQHLKIIMTILLMLLSISGWAQSIEGKLVDETTQEPLPYATVTTLSSEKQIISGTITDDQGKFNLNVDDQVQYLEIGYIGYEKRLISRPFDTNLVLSLKAASTNLNEVVIEAERTSTEIKIDKKVINFGADLQMAGGNALEAFTQLPQVQTDPITRSVSLRGSSNIQILVNGKPSPLNNADLLEQINASRIDRVEIITSPSAKYQADGMSGIINIILKDKVVQGISGSFNSEISTAPGYSFGGNLTGGFRSINLQGNISYRDFYHTNQTDILREIPGRATQDVFRDMEFEGDVINYDLKADWFISESSDLSASYSFTNNSHFVLPTTTISADGNEGVVNRLSNFHEHLTYVGNINFEHRFSKSKTRSLLLDVNVNQNNNTLPSEATTDGVVTLDNDLFFDNTIVNAATDLEWEFSENSKLEAGTLYTFKAIDNEQIDFNREPELKSVYLYKEHTYAGYLQWAQSVGKFSMQLGLRGEYLHSSGELTSTSNTIEQEFFNLFPTVHVNYTSSDKLSYFFGYSRRINRPGFYHLNPLTTIYNPLFRREGNPNLTPEFTNNLEVGLSFNAKNVAINHSFYFRKSVDLINQNFTVDEEGITVMNFGNGGFNEVLGFETSVNYDLSAKVGLNMSMMGYRINANPQISDFYFDEQYSYNLSSRVNYKATDKLSFDLQWNFEGHERMINTDRDPFHHLNIAARLNMLNNQGTLSLRITDVYKGRVTRSENVSNMITETMRWEGLTRMAMLSFTYRFSDGTIKNRVGKRKTYDMSGTKD